MAGEVQRTFRHRSKELVKSVAFHGFHYWHLGAADVVLPSFYRIRCSGSPVIHAEFPTACVVGVTVSAVLDVLACAGASVCFL